MPGIKTNSKLGLVHIGANLNPIPDGEYLVTEEDYFITEEDNENAFISLD